MSYEQHAAGRTVSAWRMAGVICLAIMANLVLVSMVGMGRILDVFGLASHHHGHAIPIYASGPVRGGEPFAPAFGPYGTTNWKGSYRCDGVSRKVSLTLETFPDGTVSAELRLRAADDEGYQPPILLNGTGYGERIRLSYDQPYAEAAPDGPVTELVGELTGAERPTLRGTLTILGAAPCYAPLKLKKTGDD